LNEPKVVACQWAFTNLRQIVRQRAVVHDIVAESNDVRGLVDQASLSLDQEAGDKKDDFNTWFARAWADLEKFA
jgi:hypothetical protein